MARMQVGGAGENRAGFYQTGKLGSPILLPGQSVLAERAAETILIL
jgi:hypothetical protein